MRPPVLRAWRTIVFFGKERESGYLYQMKEDGTGKEKVTLDR